MADIEVTKGRPIMDFGGIAGGLINAATTAWQNKQNVNEAAKNRRWQEAQATTAFSRSMTASNTAHQREVADLKAAGLNPILSAGGKGASAPTAGMGSGAQARHEKMNVLEGASAIATMRNLKAQNNLIQQQAEVASATANKVKAETKRINNQVDITNIPARALSNANDFINYFEQNADDLGRGTKWLFNDFMSRAPNYMKKQASKLVPDWVKDWEKNHISKGGN